MRKIESVYRFGIVKLIEFIDKIFPVFYGNNNREVLRRHCRSPVEAVGNIRQVVLFAIVVESPEIMVMTLFFLR